MTLQPPFYSNPEVEELLLKHNNRPLGALYEALGDKANEGIELPMAIIMDQRCGIERRAEEGLPRSLTDATPLFMAIYAGRLDVAKALLAAGADPDAKCSKGFNSLIFAARNGNLEAIETLVCYGADINAVDNHGRTPLHNAALGWHAGVIEFLERSGANLEAVDDEGCTPLHNAASIGYVAAIKALLKLGANKTAVDHDGRTPLHWVAASFYVSVAAIEAFRYNVAAFEANLTAVDKNGRTPLRSYKPRTFSIDIEISALLTQNRMYKHCP